MCSVRLHMFQIQRIVFFFVRHIKVLVNSCFFAFLLFLRLACYAFSNSLFIFALQSIFLFTKSSVLGTVFVAAYTFLFEAVLI